MTGRLSDNAYVSIVLDFVTMTDDKRNVSQINAYVPSKVKQEFKLECLKAGKTMSDVIEELVAGWLKDRKETQQ
jgi:hypothetical protein